MKHKPTIIIVICYLLVVYYGPDLMEKRKPFQLKPLLIAYNVAITGLNAWIALEVDVDEDVVLNSIEYNLFDRTN